MTESKTGLWAVAGGDALAYDRIGDGPRPVVLLHGFLGSRRNLSTLGRQWAARDRDLAVVMVDLPGHGRSPPLPPGADLSTAAEAVVALTLALFSGTSVRIVGHSLGGRVALRALELAPGSVADVTLLDIGPGPVSGDRSTRQTISLLRSAPAQFSERSAGRAFFLGGGLSPALADWLLMNLHAPSESAPSESAPSESAASESAALSPPTPGAPSAPVGLRWRIDREALVAYIERTSREDLWPVVARYPRRVHCVRGALSSYVGDEELTEFNNLGVIPVTTLAGAGHFLHVDAPAALLDALVLQV